MSGFRSERIGADTPAWRRVRSERVADCRVFRVRRDTAVNPRGGGEHGFYVVEAPDWVNVIPLTEAGEVVMIEQYRHGAGEVTLEVPGGMVDEGETPAAAAARELLEETGYEAAEMIALGRTRPNPAIQDNWQHAFLTRGARFRREPAFDATEHCAVRLLPLADIPALIAAGVITHSLVIVAFHRLGLWRDGMIKEAVSY
ncbi:MAG TPA: NUDIX hydrolase [Pyrinomonadaceae bacterium]